MDEAVTFALEWDKIGEKLYETGVDRGVLYIPNASGVYDDGYAWNGLTAVNESPSGAEANDIYADNSKYLSLMSAEKFDATLEAYTYPDKFEECDGSATVAPGVTVGQQTRKPFGFSYRTIVGNDVSGDNYGYKIHLLYGCKAAPSSRDYSTVNDSPEAVSMSWEINTTPVNVPNQKPTATLVIDTTKVTDKSKITALEKILYGYGDVKPKLPTPSEIIEMFKA